MAGAAGSLSGPPATDLQLYDSSMWWRRQPRPGRAELIERKHELEGMISALAADLKRLKARDEPTAGLEARLERLRDQHYQTRLEIDRSHP